MKLLSLTLFSLVACFTLTSHGAACCGGSSGAAQLVTGDDLKKLSLTFSKGEVVVDSVDTNGFWQKWDDHTKTDLLKIEYAQYVSDRWQSGLGLPFFRKQKADLVSAGIGDIQIFSAYEFLPDWDYNPLRPHGLMFIQYNLPRSVSKIESQLGALDTRGMGYESLMLGVLLSKNYKAFDFFFQPEIHQSFSQSGVRLNDELVSLKPGRGGSVTFGSGYHISSWRYGLAVSFYREDPVEISRAAKTDFTSAESYGQMSLSFSRRFADQLSISATYSDQTLIGSPFNTSLGRTFALALTKNWPR